ncbi:peroxisome biogenesis factor 10 [Mucor velutinosus]|uniref:Peroxisome biogenesis factor 10 n=1 Tax=Mucor velutinosus TaxID=708070 RepID=A0AAN7DQB5_9FUNG|nr:peroxisome biogenesis factor 10 [Mucor velutinosus]
MIWHLYGDSSNDGKVIMTDSSGQMIHQYKSFTSSDIDSKKTTYTSPHSQSLFLNFTTNPGKVKEVKIKPKAASRKTATPSPSSTSAAPSAATKKASVKVSGVNILNRKNLDSKTIIDRIQKRRESHNNLERRRRSSINHTISELSRVIPSQRSSGQPQKLNKHSILKLALDHILYLQTENALIKQQLRDAYNGVPVERYPQYECYHPHPGPYYSSTSSASSASSASSI